LICSHRQYLEGGIRWDQRQQATRRNDVIGLIKPRLDGATSVSSTKEKTLLFRRRFRECERARAISVKSARKKGKDGPRLEWPRRITRF
jgi:hypothetical protein